MPAPKVTAKPEEAWRQARLIPTTGIGGQDEQEQRATSSLLAVMGAVPQFGRAVLDLVGAPGGRIQTFTEIRFVDEDTTPRPVSARSRERLAAENAWLRFGVDAGKPVHVFRLAGIYGPGRNALAQLAAGTARRIVKPGQVFNRIHVEDIAAVLAASVARPRAGAVYNLADDEPAPPQDVVAYAAGLAGIASPPAVAYAEARLTEMAASFWGECKRVSNRRIKDELGVALSYPSYREGLAALHAAGEGRRSGQAA